MLNLASTTDVRWTAEVLEGLDRLRVLADHEAAILSEPAGSRTAR